jgi:hypothetical protein
MNTARNLDQFYTDPNYAKYFYNKILEYINVDDFDIVLEPSAGTGNFYNLFPAAKRVGVDLEPKAQGVIKQNFFDYQPKINSKVITIGNPPFGKNSTLAIQFFNHAAKFSDVIAFVLPRTFKKDSVINRLDKNFHLVYEEIVPDNSFIFNNNQYNVWCCAQIWVKKSEPRENIKRYTFKDVSKWFEIVEPEHADFSVQRVGGKAGVIRTVDFKSRSPLSHYYIKQHDPKVLDVFQTIDYQNVKFNTAGNPSISPSELIKLWLDAAAKMGLI